MLIHHLLANIWEEIILISAGNLTLCRSTDFSRIRTNGPLLLLSWGNWNPFGLITIICEMKVIKILHSAVLLYLNSAPISRLDLNQIYAYLLRFPNLTWSGLFLLKENRLKRIAVQPETELTKVNLANRHPEVRTPEIMCFSFHPTGPRFSTLTTKFAF